MSRDFKNRPELHDHMLRQQHLVFRFKIYSDGTPADKVHESDIPGVVHLRSEGKTADADAVETITWTAPVDDDTGDSVFGLLIDLGDNEARKVLNVRLSEISNVSTSEVVTGPNASADDYLTDSGNIAIEVAATGLDLSTEDCEFVLEVDYLEA